LGRSVPGLAATDVQTLIKINHTGQFGRIRQGAGVARTQSSGRFSVNIAGPLPGIVMAMILPKSKRMKLSLGHKMKTTIFRWFAHCKRNRDTRRFDYPAFLRTLGNRTDKAPRDEPMR
jgi:hypothetical protein